LLPWLKIEELNMKRTQLNYLRCIHCGDHLEYSNELKRVEIGDEIIHGGIRCLGCSTLFPIINGVGVFFEKPLFEALMTPAEKKILEMIGFHGRDDGNHTTAGDSEKLVRTVENWSYQWNEVLRWKTADFDGDGFCGEKCFRAFIPIEAGSYRDKKVVIWCGGNGREAYHVARSSPALIVVVEIGDEIYRIRNLFAPDANLLLLRCDMLKNPLKSRIADISICDHALQHLSDHAKAAEMIADVLVDEGVAGICAYSYENNFLMTHVIEPMKCIFHALPLKLLRLVSSLPALVIYFLINFVYMPLGRYNVNLARKIPLYDHMAFWSECDFKFIWTACFDLMHAPISYHFKKEEIEALAASNRLEIRKLVNTHGTTWSLVAVRTTGSQRREA